jgi:hypothetical protein
MRRKKTHKKTSYKKRRRSGIGAVSSSLKSTLMDLVYGVGGAIIGKKVSTLVATQAEGVDATAAYAKYLGAATPILVGAFLPKLIKKKSPAIEGIRKGMLIAGGLELAGAAGIAGLPGYYVPMVGALNPMQDYRSDYVPAVGAVDMNMDMAGCGYGY